MAKDSPVQKSSAKPRRAGRKSGGRAGRHAKRKQGAVGMAVRPGTEGGAYKPLSDRDIERIHDTALDVLANIGIGDPIPEMLEYALPKGCTLDDSGRLLFPRALVEELIDVSAKEYVAHAPNPKNDQEIKGNRVHMATSGEAVNILDYDTQTYRPSTLVDLYDAARLADQLEHIHNFGQPFIASEWSEDVFVHDMNIAYAELAGTQKPIALGIAMVDHIDPLIALFDAYLGREGGFLERPFCIFGGCPIVSPLRFGKENAEVLVKVAQLGMTADIAIAAQAGATAPAALAGALVQTFASSLACLCIVNLIRPGAAINFGIWPFISDLRTGAFSGGSGEEALVIAAATQVANHYGFTTSVPSGMTDSKTMDAQAGYEKAITTTAVALAGGNIVSAYPGIVGSLLAQSFEGMVIDNDMLGSVMRLLRGIEVSDETLSYDIIENTVRGVGHYLNQGQTLEIMQTEYLYPEIGDRRTANDWQDGGKETVYELAHARVNRLLSSHYPEYISPEADARIRDKFPIKLDPKDMKPGNGRWGG
ncbi:MAG: trimethylamine methyltransferase family protein [Deltaproteobacteria bacterium]|jgi:trimethylamine--corrinoid protein Co-methyltransferase|nr:trimethylamine methyltransferase family protein [Deltaproteobacteria bacterium]